jgi:phosphatidylglycerophosphate synthase
MGTLVFIAAVLTTAYYCPGFTGDSPQWTFLFTTIAAIFYQTMDGLDGKHARNTKSGSALGEMFDHGCDSLITVLLVAYTNHCSSLGLFNWVSVIGIVAAAITFFVSNLTLLHRGVQQFNYIDCQEGQLFIQFWIFMTYMYGSALHLYQVVIPAYPVLLQILSYIPASYWAVLPPKDHVGDYSHPHYYLDANGETLSIGIEIRWIGMIFATFSAFKNLLIAFHTLQTYYTCGNVVSTKPGRGLSEFHYQVFSIFVWALLCVAAFALGREINAADPCTTLAWLILVTVTFSDYVRCLLLTRVTLDPFPRIAETPGFWCLLSFAASHGLPPTIAMVGRYAATLLAVYFWFSVSAAECRRVAKALGIRVFSISKNE